MVGKTRQEARAKYDQLQQVARSTRVGLARLSQTFGDLSGYPSMVRFRSDKLGPAELHSISAQLLARSATAANPTIRELYHEVAGMGGFCLIGTGAGIADVMQEWFENDGCDGFNITPTHLPGGCEDFVEMVTPELQRRGLFREEATKARTLRENLGLKRPVNRYIARRGGWSPLRRPICFAARWRSKRAGVSATRGDRPGRDAARGALTRRLRTWPRAVLQRLTEASQSQSASTWNERHPRPMLRAPMILAPPTIAPGGESPVPVTPMAMAVAPMAVTPMRISNPDANRR